MYFSINLVKYELVTWMSYKVISIHYNDLLSQLLGHQIEHLVQLLEADLTRVKVVPAWWWGREAGVIN